MSSEEEKVKRPRSKSKTDSPITVKKERKSKTSPKAEGDDGGEARRPRSSSSSKRKDSRPLKDSKKGSKARESKAPAEASKSSEKGKSERRSRSKSRDRHSKVDKSREGKEAKEGKEERREERAGAGAAGPPSSPQLTSPTRASDAQVLLISNRDVVSQQQRSGGQSMVTPDHFTVLRVIGEGAFGKVFLVTKKKTGERMAMKVMKKQSILQDGDDSLRHVIHELEFMRDMSHHPFIVSLYHSFQTATDVNIVMEWVGGGSLFELLVNRDDPFAEDEAQFFAAQVLLAVQALHSNDIVYRDLKLENILLDGDGYIRLSDFGLSSRAKHGDRIHSFSGTATYLAPEIIEDTGEKGHDRSVDMWCFGVMLFIMLTQEPPFYAEHYPDLFNLIRSTEIPYDFYSYLSPKAVSILKGLLTKDPKRRLGCGPRGLAEVQDHPFFSGISWKNLLAKKTPSPYKPNIYYGKPLEDAEDEEEEDGAEGGEPKSAPIDVFKGFSFVWDPNAAHDVLTESIEVVGGTGAKGGIYKRKNHIVMNFFVWIKEVQGLSANEEGSLLLVRWKHECRKQLTSVGPDANVVQDQTEAKACSNRSVVYEGGMDNACIPFDYLMVQDRNSNAFEPRPLHLTLASTPAPGAKGKKKSKERVLGTLVLDMADYGFHKLQQTQILTMDGSGATLTISIVCTWKAYNGDPVDNYEKASMRLGDRASRQM
mmetsp:Transcript_21854/g.85604  ORF Transcript_21854/g.85604 Transcript_21854/m.85604 type:complete len:707 (-) Transcript_21854:106-2226(-)